MKFFEHEVRLEQFNNTHLPTQTDMYILNTCHQPAPAKCCSSVTYQILKCIGGNRGSGGLSDTQGDAAMTTAPEEHF